MNTIKITLERGFNSGGEYRLSQIIGAITVATWIDNKRNEYRVGDSFAEAIAKELSADKLYTVTVKPVKP